MRAKFFNFFYWATVGETSDPAEVLKCTVACMDMTEMCCATLLMEENDQTGLSAYEQYCINTSVVEINHQFHFDDFSLTINCQNEVDEDQPNKKKGAMNKAMLSAASVSAILASFTLM